MYKRQTVSDVLWEIQRQTDFTFIYSTNDLKNVKVRNLRVTNGKIAAVLDECLKNSGLAYVCLLYTSGDVRNHS